MQKFFSVFILLSLFLLAGCSQTADSGYRTMPVTNNPNIVPSHGSGIPGIPGGTSSF
ncbi:MAG TPA: hypothetical protein P5048_01820 [Chlamydiales bacterium]|nr:hypothetical protein [Chlamydiales bacterium]